MIYHTVVVTKPKVEVVVRPVSSIGIQVTSQGEYNEYLNSLMFTEGDFVTMTPVDVTHKQQIHMVCAIQTDFLKVGFARMFEPKPYLMVSATEPEVAGLGRWARWDTENNYRKLTQSEYLKYIGNNYDSISSGCHAVARQFQSNPSGLRST